MKAIRLPAEPRLGILSLSLSGLALAAVFALNVPSSLMEGLTHPLFMPLGAYLVDTSALWDCFCFEALGAALLAGILSRSVQAGKLGVAAAFAGMTLFLLLLALPMSGTLDSRALVEVVGLLICVCAAVLAAVIAWLLWGMTRWAVKLLRN